MRYFNNTNLETKVSFNKTQVGVSALLASVFSDTAQKKKGTMRAAMSGILEWKREGEILDQFAVFT